MASSSSQPAREADPILLAEIEEGVALLTLNRPERLNAIDDAWIDGLHGSLDRIEASKTIRVVVVTGAGRGFCAGADLKREGPMLPKGGAAVNVGMQGQARLSA